MCQASHLVLGRGLHVPWQPRSLIGQCDAVGDTLLIGDSFGVVWFGSPCSLLVVPTRCVTLEVTNQHDTHVFLLLLLLMSPCVQVHLLVCLLVAMHACGIAHCVLG